MRLYGFVAVLVSTHLLQTVFSKGNEQPIFAEPIPNVTVAVGRDASLPCVVDNLGSHKVAWVHLDRQMIVSIHRQVVTRIRRFSVSHDHHRTWWLHIRGAQAEDAGRYMCQVNCEPMISQTGSLHVVVPPTIVDADSSPSQLSFREGARVTLVCRATGVPAPRVVWKREDGRSLSGETGLSQNVPNQFQGEELVISKVSRVDSGAYLCIASNGIPPTISKRITLEVEFPPTVWIPNQLLGSPLSSTVTLECLAEAHPRPITYWVRTDPVTFNDVMILPSKRLRPEVTYVAYKTHMRLHVATTESQDFGNYRCIAKNSLGEAEGSIRLYEMAVVFATTKATDTRQRTAAEDNFAGVPNTTTSFMNQQPSDTVKHDKPFKTAKQPNFQEVPVAKPAKNGNPTSRKNIVILILICYCAQR